MQVQGDTLEQEVRLTMEAAIDLTNAVRADATEVEIRQILVDHTFGAVESASAEEVAEAHRAITWLAGLIDELPQAPIDEAVEMLNRALATRAVAPSISGHDSSPLHIHWTAEHVPLAGRVVVDILMAFAQTICDCGVDRFGRCGADGCDSLFYDATKNRSRRFCNDTRCASRTHTASHRARNRTNAGGSHR